MPTSSSGRESRHGSKSGPSGSDAYKSSERREKSKSSQTYDGRRRGSRQVDGGHANTSERPQLKSRTNSAPLVDRRQQHDAEDGVQTGSSTPRATRGGFADGRDEDEVAGAAGTMKNSHLQNPELSEPQNDINIAIIGADGVGKSTFVQQALELSQPPTSLMTQRRLTIKGDSYTVSLIEFTIDNVDIDDDDLSVSWPDFVHNTRVPRIDGALTLYDIKDETSLAGVRKMLSAIFKSGIASLLISCKCDAAFEECEVDPTDFEQEAKKAIKGLKTLQVSASTPETQKRGLSLILQAILSERSEAQTRSSSATRRRAQSNAIRGVSPRAANDRGHARAASELTGNLHKEQRHSRHDSSVANYGPNERLKIPHEAPHLEMPGSFLFEESASEAASESAHSSVEAFQQPGATKSSTSINENGATFDELVDRLLAQPISKGDTKFAAIFLALFRKFAAPGRLLEAIVERFDSLDRNGNAQLIKTTNQMRFVAIMEQWVGTYPGDFAYPKTKRRMQTFVAKLGQERIFTVAAKEINADLDAVHEDDDTNWAYCDSRRGTARSSLTSTASLLIDDPSFQFPDHFTLSGNTLLDDPSGNLAPRDDATRSMSSSTISSQQLMVNVEAAQKEAELLQPSPRQPLTKTQWRALMDFSDDMIARELTRMDFIMFSSIRPRDLVRQVSLNDEQKSHCKNLSHVERMIDHFNQLACWVQNYILLRDKPKHRALMLEKFMRIARKLREMNNYNALGAVIAGIKSTAVHRLGATRELIPPNIGKDWLKLEILMAPSRSYFAYRLAWENSSTERIPYLPLHRRDLVAAEQGNKTFVGDEKHGRVNWRKFEIMGDVIVSMQKAQGMPYKGLGGVRGNVAIRELVLDVELVKDEDELFERSKMLEPSGAGAGAASTKFKEFFKR